MPERADIILVGDSYVYGYGAPPGATISRQLAALTGQEVYGVGVGGYGPCEYEVVVDENLDLDPKTVIVGLFVGNDVANAYTATYPLHRFPQFRSQDPGVLAAGNAGGPPGHAPVDPAREQGAF